MILTLVRFPVVGPPLPPAERDALIAATAPRYQSIPGLRRKYFLSADAEGGGAYEWLDRASAERWFDAAWYAQMQQRYGVRPTIEWFDAPCLVDNVVGLIVTEN